MTSCKYHHPQQSQCSNTLSPSEESEGLCFWHQNTIKDGPDLKDRLEQEATKNHRLIGYQLRKSQLDSINLVNLGHKEGFALIDCDLYRANLSESHLFGCDLSGSSLMKSDLRFSNLHCANLTGCNLLGTRLEGCRLDKAVWGDQIIQEQQAKQAGWHRGEPFRLLATGGRNISQFT